MRIGIFGALVLITALVSKVNAQQVCGSSDYQQKAWLMDPSVKIMMDRVEGIIQQQLDGGSQTQQRGEKLFLITIPVVVHVVYHDASQNISDENINYQIRLLNQCFRRLNADTAKTPERFRSVAADCDIEFKLAISDPARRATTGIIRKYSPVGKWEADDQVKFTNKGGDDAWDPNNYLNIWVCNLNRMIGYASFPGGEAAKDGIVMNYNSFRASKTLVHEAGHWMGLKHLWGDADCGDDGVDDTPKQSTFTSGCPSGIRLSPCGNAPNGDMYMNYMDFTNDECTNLFTDGQKSRMRSVFAKGASRQGILNSYGLQPPLITEIPVGEPEPKWFFANVYPNPTAGELTLDLSYDIRWVGRSITITSSQGMPQIRAVITSKIMKLDISKLKTGVYFLTAKKDDGEEIKQKLIKL
jgi:hypothetical protein